jgi:hypothetical protein
VTDRLLHPEPEARQEPDLIPTGKIVAVGIGALLVFVLGILGATVIWMRGSRAYLPMGPAPIPEEVGRGEIGNIFQRSFEQQLDAQELRDDQRRQLEGYGWADRPRGVIHVPVEQAYEPVLRGRRP